MIDSIRDTILMLPGIIMALSFHEFAHAWVSDKLGDPTPRRQGRLTLNPIAHIDPLGLLALVLVHFGWGKPVQINPSYYKDRRKGEFLVGIAGVSMNLILAVLIAIPLRFINFGADSMIMDDIRTIMIYAVMINLVLMVFNLIPCPPLDGFGLVTQIFKLDTKDWWYNVYNNGRWILIILLVTDVVDAIITPVVTFFMKILLF